MRRATALWRPRVSEVASAVSSSSAVLASAADRARASTAQQPESEIVDSLPRLVVDILRARGVASVEQTHAWLNPSLKSLRDPFLLTDMEKAVQRLVRARESGESIVVYADYDLDGTSGLALVLRALKAMGYQNVVGYQPKRLSEGYGLHKAAIEKLHAQGCTLLLSVDLGITALEEVELAHRLGLDVIISDHHLPKETLPDALAVVNPNRGNCPSQLGHLCGTGVAFYMMMALRRELAALGRLETLFDLKVLLDCFAIGTLTDMVPLIEENRVLVKHGLLQLAQTDRVGLKVLLQELGLWGRPLSGQDVAIRFAPKLNALSRMEMGVQPIDLYLVEDEVAARDLVAKVMANNQDRQVSQKAAESEAAEQVLNLKPQNSIFVYSQNFHRGVVGLVATRLVQEQGLPTFVGSFDAAENRIVGSARLPEGMNCNLLDAMAAAGEVLEQFGGHAAAAGFELRFENALEFRARLEAYFGKQALEAKPRNWVYDSVATLAEMNESFMQWSDHLGPYGAHFPPPMFFFKSVRIAAAKALRGGHYKLTLTDSERVTRVALWFSPAETHTLFEADLVGRSVDVLAEPQWNYFAGQKTLQLLIQDIRSSEVERQLGSSQVNRIEMGSSSDLVF